MTNEIPLWWLVLSAIFFVVSIVLVIILAMVALKVVQFMQTLSPKVDELTTKVNGLIVKVEGVATRVEEVAVSVKDTVDGVSGRAKGVVGSVELIASTGARQFEKFSPLIVGVMTAARVVKSIVDMRNAQKIAEERRKAGVTKKSGGILSLLGK